MDKISIICAAYNEEELFEKHLISLVNQTYANKEIIIVDDGSTDDTGNIGKKFARKYSYVHYYRIDHKKGYGCVRPRLYGVKKSKGKILFIVDANAYYEKDYLKKCVTHLAKPDVYGVIGHISVWNPTTFISKYKNLLYKKRFDNPRTIKKEIDDGKLAAWVIKKSVYDEIGGYDLTQVYNEDIDLAHKARKLGYKIVYEPHAHWLHKWEEQPISYMKKQFFIGKSRAYVTSEKNKLSQLLLFSTPLFLVLLGLFHSFFFWILGLHLVLLYIRSIKLFITSMDYKKERWAALRGPTVVYLTHIPTALGYYYGLLTKIKRNAKRYSKKLALLIVVLIACFIIAEFLVRVIPVDDAGFERIKLKQQYFLATKTNPHWGTTFVPNSNTQLDYTGREQEINVISFTTVPIPGFEQYGMRDDGIDESANKYIPVLGDSFTWGAALEREEIWSERIEEQHKNIDMINLGQGAGTAQSFTIYKNVMEHLPPHDTILYQLWLGNEFIDNYAFSKLDLTELQETENNLHRSRWFYPIITTSKVAYLFYNLYFVTNLPVKRFLNTMATRLQFISFNQKTIVDYVPEYQQYIHPELGNFDINPNNQIKLAYARTDNTNPVYLQGVEETKKSLTQFKEFADQQNKNLIIIIFPFKEQIYFEIIQEEISYDVEIKKPNNIIVDHCKQINLECIDITDNIQEYKDEKLFWNYDNHFTPRGQEIASQIIEKKLEKQFQ